MMRIGSIDTWADYLNWYVRDLYRSLTQLEHGPCREWLIAPETIPSNWANLPTQHGPAE